MRKAAIVALLAVGSSIAVFAAVNQPKAKAQKAQLECCDKSECCPTGEPEECCEVGCE